MHSASSKLCIRPGGGKSYALWGGQSWPQAPFRRLYPLESGSAGRMARPTMPQQGGHDRNFSGASFESTDRHNGELRPLRMDLELEMLMARYQNGVAAAATALVDRPSPALYRFFLVHFLSRRYADDLLQETWMRIHEARHTYRVGEPVLPWLYAI